QGNVPGHTRSPHPFLPREIPGFRCGAGLAFPILQASLSVLHTSVLPCCSSEFNFVHLITGGGMKLVSEHCSLVSSAELEMHGIPGFSYPIPSPFKSGSAKYRDYRRIHVAGSSLLISLGIE